MFRSESKSDIVVTMPLPDLYRHFQDTQIETTFSDNSTKHYEIGTPFSTIMKDAPFYKDDLDIVALKVNGAVLDMNDRVRTNIHTIEPVLLNTTIGGQIYRRSLSFALCLAVSKLFPQTNLLKSYSLGNSYVYEVTGTVKTLSDQDVTNLDKLMRNLVAMQKDIVRREVTFQEAVSYFTQQEMFQTVAMLTQRNSQTVALATCEGYCDMWHDIHLPNTKFLRTFELRKYGDSRLVLSFPVSSDHSTLPPFEDIPNLADTYNRGKEWGRMLGITCVGEVNRLIRRGAPHGELSQFVLICEAYHDRRTVEIATEVINRPNCRLILIAGPSSSGKTTFAHKLSVQMRVLGKDPAIVSLDNFYVNREDCPKDENGDYDFECAEALDLPYLNDVLAALVKGKEVLMPVFDFVTGTRKHGSNLRLKDNGLLIVEGIHALNDRLTTMIERDQKYKIFISALPTISLDNHNRIPSTDSRLIRRIVRDYQFRGYTAEETLSRWPSVRNGEEKLIFPFQVTADTVYNSALDYELCALKIIADPLLHQVNPTSPFYAEAYRICHLLSYFSTVPHKYIPPSSIIREFIGDSIFVED
ncbi:putative nucleoside kinase [Blattamonas nauphoetae]|uniref:Nucleoside kinase n=1 Tax=Blattamonas nauphoetae TaxID=2049346 RepID=A0ABQ9YDJ0_9EUKA|nr:putative nucleoside kinase [Blattamonas nauphoetae]